MNHGRTRVSDHRLRHASVVEHQRRAVADPVTAKNLSGSDKRMKVAPSM